MLDDGVTSLADIDDQTVVDIGADIAMFGRDGGKREQAVELGEDVGVELHLRHPLAEREHEFLVEAVLDDLDTLFGRGDFLLVGLEFVGDIPLGADECLLANPLGRHLLFVGIADLEVVAKDIVEAYLEALYARAFYLALLYLEQIFLAVGLDSSQLVEFGVDATSDDVRPSLRQGRVGHYLPLDTAPHLGTRVELLTQQREVGIFGSCFAESFDRRYRP